MEEQNYHSADEVTAAKDIGLAGGNTWLWKLDFAEGWETENWCIRSKDLPAATAYPVDSQKNEWQRAARNVNRPSTS